MSESPTSYERTPDTVVVRRDRGAAGWWIAALVAVVAVAILAYMLTANRNAADLQAARDQGRAEASLDAATASAQMAAAQATQAARSATDRAAEATQAAAANTAEAARDTAQSASTAAGDMAADAATNEPATPE